MGRRSILTLLRKVVYDAFRLEVVESHKRGWAPGRETVNQKREADSSRVDGSN